MASFVELSNPTRLREKEDQLFAILERMGRVIVAFSGGTDSAYLGWAANRVLGANALAVTADSASLPESHKRDAEEFVSRFGIAHEYVQTYEFDNPDYFRNDPNRCFHCKDELFTRLEQVGRERGYEHVTDPSEVMPAKNVAVQSDAGAVSNSTMLPASPAGSL